VIRDAYGSRDTESPLSHTRAIIKSCRLMTYAIKQNIDNIFEKVSNSVQFCLTPSVTSRASLSRSTTCVRREETR
jgi:hypothetical protein